MNLALNQASDSLRESKVTRDGVDTKIYGMIALSTTLLVLLITLMPWSSKGFLSACFVLVALGA
jgi:hypothetical protein